MSGGRSRSFLPYQDFLQALHGFILVTTAQGKLVYVSENVSDYLGLSMVSRQNKRLWWCAEFKSKTLLLFLIFLFR